MSELRKSLIDVMDRHPFFDPARPSPFRLSPFALRPELCGIQIISSIHGFSLLTRANLLASYCACELGMHFLQLEDTSRLGFIGPLEH